MQDKEIIQLFWYRDQEAVNAARGQYGSYCGSIAMNLLQNHEDAEEILNDTFLKAWQSIPPARPDSLKIYLGRITRNLALNRIKYAQADKRDRRLSMFLDELAEAASGDPLPEDEIAAAELTDHLNAFLAALPEDQRDMFLRRYWFGDSIREIAERHHKREGTISVTLHRIRLALSRYLNEKGVGQ